jgi:hypothetical protein
MAISQMPALGLECKLYYNTGTHAAPTWALIAKAINVSANLSKGDATAPARESTWQKYRGTLKDLEITFTYRKKAGTDTVFDALQAAYIANTIYEYAVLDALVTESGAQGVRAFCEVMALNVTQELENFEEAEFTLRPVYKEESSAVVNPDWYKVT